MILTNYFIFLFSITNKEAECLVGYLDSGGVIFYDWEPDDMKASQLSVGPNAGKGYTAHPRDGINRPAPWAT